MYASQIIFQRRCFRSGFYSRNTLQVSSTREMNWKGFLPEKFIEKKAQSLLVRNQSKINFQLFACLLVGLFD